MRFFTPYKPPYALPNVGYLRDENGIDWYEAQGDYPAGDLVICVNTQGRICSAGRDISGAFPLNMAVYAIDDKDIPKDFDEAKPWGWDFNEGRIVPHVLTEQERQERKSDLLDIAKEYIDPLQDAVELGIATNEEIKRLNQWRQYRVALSRLDVKDANAQFPDAPEKAGEQK